MIRCRAMRDAQSATPQRRATQRHPERGRRPVPDGVLAAAAALLLAGHAVACARPARVADEAMLLYNQGKYEEALPLLEKALEASPDDGRLQYQIGYCREAVQKDAEARQRAWKTAEPLLEAEVGREDGATLERLYYLTAINAFQGDSDRMVQFARQGVERFEKGPNPNALTGEDWFRLGRMRDFLQEASEAEAAYRRAVSAFDRVPAQNPAYHALALVRVADLDFEAGRLAAAGEAYDRALALLPGTNQVRPFRHALALVALGRFEAAAGRFEDARRPPLDDPDPEILNEAQYGADLARKARAVEPLDDKDADGTPIAGLPPEMLTERLKAAAAALRASRDKHSYRAGDPLSGEVARDQRRFIALLREYFVSQKRMQELCVRNGFADLVRR
jgi:tetratricopeptide (TPR) repeat protein